jgi:hypothetical protein
MEELYEKFGWDLYRKYGHAYDAFKLAIAQPERILGGYGLSQDVMNVLLPVRFFSWTRLCKCTQTHTHTHTHTHWMLVGGGEWRVEPCVCERVSSAYDVILISNGY